MFLGRLVGALAAVTVAGALVLTLGLRHGGGLRGLAGNETRTPADLRAQLQATGPLVVFSEFGEEADTLWAADPDDPTDRTRLGQVAHAPGFGIGPSLSPDGSRIAYVVLPADAPRPAAEAPAELWVQETASPDASARRLAEGVDLLSTPVWSPTGDVLVVRRIEWGEGEAVYSHLLRIDLAGTVTPLVASEAALFPIDFSPDGAWLYYAALSAGGTDLARVPASGGASQTLFRLSDGVARDWQLSPDGARLAYLAQAPSDADVAFVAQVLDLTTGQVETPLPDLRVAQFAPVWEPQGGLTVGRFHPAARSPVRLSGGDAGIVTGAFRAPPQGFDVPLSWSPDGAQLAVRSFAGTSPAEPGPSRVVVVGSDGARHELSPVSDVVIAGWLR